MKKTLNESLDAKCWPFAEARNLVKRFEKAPPVKGYCLFETGYGPSGLPHIGTFGEVVRTTFVRNAFAQLSDIPTRMFCISDDMDGMRKVPENLPQQQMLAEHLHKPLTQVPDPFGTHDSYGAHMNARLVAFLDNFGFDYEFKSSSELYQNGTFDEKLQLMLERYDAVMKLMLPTLGEERQQTYSPFLPISPTTGRVLYVPMEEVRPDSGTVVFKDEDGSLTELPVTGGHVKLQWKPDFGMRWAALGVDYEMFGKDHLANAKLYSAIARILGGTPPEQFVYELFLDEQGGKISKSKGNGITIDEWLTYAPEESLALYMFNSPKKAKKLHFDVIPQQADEYLKHRDNLITVQAPLGLQSGEAFDVAAKLADGSLSAPDITKVVDNPVWHIHGALHEGKLPTAEPGEVSFALLLNLVSVSSAEDKELLWGFISRYAPEATPENAPLTDALAGYAIRYYHDFIKPTKQFRAPTEQERAAIAELGDMLATTQATSAEDLQTDVFTVGKNHGFENLRDWFKALYEVLLGQSQGPRMGSFIALYGKDEMRALIDRALKGEDLAA